MRIFTSTFNSMSEHGFLGVGLRQRGTAMLELAIILPLLVILLFGFIEIGRAFYQENILTRALVTGARFMAREPDAVDRDTCQPGDAWSAAVNEAVRLVVYRGSDGSLRLPELDQASAVTFGLRVETVGASPACVIHAEARAQFAAIFGDSIVPMLNLGPFILNATVEERYIGE